MLKSQWRGLAIVCGGVGALLVGQAVAQEAAQQERQQQQLQQQRQAGQQAGQHNKQKICLGSHLEGAAIKDSKGQEIGKVKDLVISTEGKVEYLAISMMEGAAGQRSEAQSQTQRSEAQSQERERPSTQQAASGQKLTLIPWDVAEFKEGQGASKQPQITVSLEKSQLQQAPSFSEQQLTAESGQEQLTAQVDRFFSSHRRGAARPEFNREGQERQNPLQRQQQQQQEKQEKPERQP